MIVSTSAGEIDLSSLPPPRPGRPAGKMHQDPLMQEARKRARILRNRAAAQLSREKKRQHLEGLEQENLELREKNEELEQRLSKTEASNADLAGRLDTLAKQLQGFQSLLMGGNTIPTPRSPSQQTVVDESLAVASPMMNWTAEVAASTVPTATTSINALSSISPQDTTTMPSSLASTPSKLPSSSLAPVMSMVPIMTPTTLTSSVASTAAAVVASSDLSGKGLSESAALEQSDVYIYCVASDSQQRRPLSHTESIYRKQRQSLLPTTTATVAAPEMAAVRAAKWATCCSTNSCVSWSQRMAAILVSVLSMKPHSSKSTMHPPQQMLWTIFYALWWVLSQNGGWMSRRQISSIARGILQGPPSQRTGNNGRAIDNDLCIANLNLMSSWLRSGSRTAIALRRVMGNEPVDKVSSLVAKLRIAVRSTSSSPGGNCLRYGKSNSNYCNKQHQMFYPPF